MFDYESKGNCSACHTVNLASDHPEDSAFTDFTYKATGVPRNPAIPRNSDPNFFDLGLCGPEREPPVLPSTVAPGMTIENFCGKFRVTSLRNVAERQAFMHNGVFKDLHEVVRFYSKRNVATVSDDLPPQYQVNIERTHAPFNRHAHTGPALTEAEIGEIVAFLHTLSDGYKVP
jgi:cytochrome c peroxidase